MARQTATNPPPTVEEFRQILKNHELKATPQRLAVHEAMLNLGHASADMVADYVSAHSSSRLSIASVYNILSQLALLGVYQHRLSSNNKMFFDVNTFRHAHLYDSENHEFKDVVDDSLFEFLDTHFKRRSFRGYKVDAIDVQIVCHPSAKKTTSIL